MIEFGIVLYLIIGEIILLVVLEVFRQEAENIKYYTIRDKFMITVFFVFTLLLSPIVVLVDVMRLNAHRLIKQYQTM